MRTLIAGLAALALGIGATEYLRRHPSRPAVGAADATADGKKKPTYPKAVAELLVTGATGTEAPAAAPELAALLTVPAGEGAGGLKPIAGGAFEARELRGGFGAALFVVEAEGRSGVVRASPGEPPQLLLSRPERITALAVDGSTVFFAAGGVVGSTLARGQEPVTVRARFENAVVTSLASAGDTVVATLMPKEADPLSTDGVGAVVALDGSGGVTLVARELVRPHAARTDGRDAYWVAGFPPALWRGALDGAYSSQLTDTAEEPLALDGDAVYFRAPLGAGPELRRVGRAGGNLVTLAAADVSHLVASSGLVRFTTGGAGPTLLEVTQGAAPAGLADLAGRAQGLALGGTTLFLLTATDDGRAVLWAK